MRSAADTVCRLSDFLWHRFARENMPDMRTPRLHVEIFRLAPLHLSRVTAWKSVHAVPMPQDSPIGKPTEETVCQDAVRSPESRLPCVFPYRQLYVNADDCSLHPFMSCSSDRSISLQVVAAHNNVDAHGHGPGAEPVDVTFTRLHMRVSFLSTI